ncbi:adenylyl-sulfate kinase [Paenibacillus sp. FSL H8-0537]|uniref:adenylyl-sulfate kinase n=1 Tax=Paenibacillus sp. FSL H8-0537 TaxID=2921399 RepID=UPI0031010F1D
MERNEQLMLQLYTVTKEMRQQQNNHKSCVIWFTGLSGSGKSTLANALEAYFFENQLKSYVLDGDNIRMGLNKNLGFSVADRTENIRRIGEVAKLFTDAGIITLAAFISPFNEDRQAVRELFAPGEFIEVYVKCSLDTCEKRDTKGLYKKARNGDIQNFTGIDSPYEVPINPEITIETEDKSITDSIEVIIQYLKQNDVVV